MVAPTVVGLLPASIPSPVNGVWNLGPIPIRAYALCIIVGIVVAVWVGNRRWVARGGAPGTVADVALMRRTVGPEIGVKAAEGIRTYADALAMIAAGANRLGTSASLKILEEAEE